jgi:sarcosine oxidase
MKSSYDVIVIGLGGMGSSAACQLAARGRKVLGLERFKPAHDRGSSHGGSRIIRLAYYEGPDYVPLLLQAYELWQQIERESGKTLLTITGGLMLGPAGSDLVAGSLRSAQTHFLPYELLDAAEIRRRYPPLNPEPDATALFEAKAGLLKPEEAVSAYLNRAGFLGAELHFEEPVIGWRALRPGEGVEVQTSSGRYSAAQLVLTPGAWAPELMTDLGLPLEVTRQVMFWFEPLGGVEPFLPERFPIYLWEPAGRRLFYGFPAIDGPKGGVKVAIHYGGVRCTPDSMERQIHPQEVEEMRSYLADRIPTLRGALVDARTCMYTNTPDGHFVIGRHPHYPQVALAAGFSGHGFKFVSVVGEILADLVVQGATRHSIERFSPTRFQSPHGE